MSDWTLEAARQGQALARRLGLRTRVTTPKGGESQLIIYDPDPSTLQAWKAAREAQDIDCNWIVSRKAC